MTESRVVSTLPSEGPTEQRSENGSRRGKLQSLESAVRSRPRCPARLGTYLASLWALLRTPSRNHECLVQSKSGSVRFELVQTPRKPTFFLAEIAATAQAVLLLFLLRRPRDIALAEGALAASS